MSWFGFIVAFSIFLMTVVLMALKYWPRNEDGEMQSLDEVENTLKQIPTGGPSPKSHNLTMLIFTTLALIAMALSK